MIKIEIIYMQQDGHKCANPDCKHDPKDMINILGNVWNIRVDTSVAFISMSGKGEYYCRSCIDHIYHLFKMKLDTKMWAFH